jgi:hypothetical protein
MAILAAGCAARVAPAPVDDILAEHVRAGQLSLRLDRPQEAAAQFRLALVRAEARDDASAIGDVGFDLVVAELEAGQPAAALRDARTWESELSRRGAPIPPALRLAEATALYRGGVRDEADRIAINVADGPDPQEAAAARFLHGLIADEAGDAVSLADAAAHLPPGSADGRELQARAALLQGDAPGARTLALQAVDLRRAALDYRGLARGLRLAGRAAELAGDQVGARQYFLRAEQSLAAQNEGRPGAIDLKE